MTNGYLELEIHFRWINSRRVSGWGSTIDTMLAVDALLMWDARFSRSGESSDMTLEVDVGNRYSRKN